MYRKNGIKNPLFNKRITSLLRRIKLMFLNLTMKCVNVYLCINISFMTLSKNVSCYTA